MKTKIKKKDKNFDAIKTMREIRDQISIEIVNMTYEEERSYLNKILKKSFIRQK